tara:strand:+ start:36387 stop:36539 length:153 start_codon:yes stop_codon:yes gene_type:complete
MKCKLCGRTPTLDLNEDLVSCRNPDCSLDEVEMSQEEWEKLMCTKAEPNE